jgi:hypothetical protein
MLNEVYLEDLILQSLILAAGFGVLTNVDESGQDSVNFSARLSSVPDSQIGNSGIKVCLHKSSQALVWELMSSRLGKAMRSACLFRVHCSFEKQAAKKEFAKPSRRGQIRSSVLSLIFEPML